ncbi:MAG: hypothetical protein COB50_02885 [Thiotrichales bacterium]|nr:MAG: hypothetical protein COB50_02885 [Thiotrichales bacterium]
MKSVRSEALEAGIAIMYFLNNYKKFVQEKKSFEEELDAGIKDSKRKDNVSERIDILSDRIDNSLIPVYKKFCKNGTVKLSDDVLQQKVVLDKSLSELRDNLRTIKIQ